MTKTIDALDPARTPYQDADLFPLGYGSTPTSTYKAVLSALATYIQSKLGTGQLTILGDVNYTMLYTDYELATSVAFTSSRTWGLVSASSVPAGQRRRIVDLVGIVGTNTLIVSPAGSDKINGVNSSITFNRPWSYIELESNGVNGWEIVDLGPGLVSNNNLSDLTNITSARANLGLGTSALLNTNQILLPGNNLSDISNAATARGNLGVGALALLGQLGFGNIDPSIISTLIQILNNTAQKLVTTDIYWSHKVPVTIPFASSSVWDFSTFRNGIYTLTANSTVIATNIKAGQSGFISLKQGVANSVIGWPVQFHFPSGMVTTLSTLVNYVDLLNYYAESTTIVRCSLAKNT